VLECDALNAFLQVLEICPAIAWDKGKAVDFLQKPHKTTNSYPHKVGNVKCMNFHTNKEVGCGGHGRAI
jgi:hypothetical protein